MIVHRWNLVRGFFFFALGRRSHDLFPLLELKLLIIEIANGYVAPFGVLIIIFFRVKKNIQWLLYLYIYQSHNFFCFLSLRKERGGEEESSFFSFSSLLNGGEGGGKREKASSISYVFSPFRCERKSELFSDHLATC